MFGKSQFQHRIPASGMQPIAKPDGAMTLPATAGPPLPFHWWYLFMTPKHRRKVNAVYPTHAGEEGPQSGKLSRLTHYCDARPIKLDKVMAYLEYKVRKDLDLERTGYNKVALEIIDALLGSCHRHIRSFAHPSLRIIELLASTGADELVIKATASFNHLCKQIDGHSMFSDSAFSATFNRVLQLYAALCVVEKSDESIEKQLRLIGLSAMKSVLQLNDTISDTDEMRIETVASALLSNLNSGHSLQSFIRKREEAVGRSASQISVLQRRTSIYDDVVTEDGLDRLALACIEIMVKRAQPQRLSILLGAVFHHLDQVHWKPASFAFNICKSIVQSLQSQQIFVVATHLVKTLQKSACTAANVEGDVTRLDAVACSTLFEILSYVLSSNRGPVGYGARELASFLLEHLHYLVSFLLPSARNAGTVTAKETEEQLMHLQRDICLSLESISSHQAFVSQLDTLLWFYIRSLAPTEKDHHHRQSSLSTGDANSVMAASNARHPGYRRLLISVIVHTAQVAQRPNHSSLPALHSSSRLAPVKESNSGSVSPVPALRNHSTLINILERAMIIICTDSDGQVRALSLLLIQAIVPVVDLPLDNRTLLQQRLRRCLHLAVTQSMTTPLTFNVACHQFVWLIRSATTPDEALITLNSTLLLDTTSIQDHERQCSLLQMVSAIWEILADQWQCKELKSHIANLMHKRLEWHPQVLQNLQFTIESQEALKHVTFQQWQEEHGQVTQTPHLGWMKVDELLPLLKSAPSWILEALQKRPLAVEYQVEQDPEVVDAQGLTLMIPSASQGSLTMLSSKHRKSRLSLASSHAESKMAPSTNSHVPVSLLKEAMVKGRKSESARQALQQVQGQRMMPSSHQLSNNTRRVNGETSAQPHFESMSMSALTTRETAGVSVDQLLNSGAATRI